VAQKTTKLKKIIFSLFFWFQSQFDDIGPTLILPILQLETQQLMMSQLRSHIWVFNTNI